MIPTCETPAGALASAGGVAIRRFQIGDAPLLYEAVQESLPELSRNMAWCADGYSHELASQFVNDSITSWGEASRFDFVIFDQADGSFLGSVGFNRLNQGHRLANIGYWVRKRRTNQGVGRRAVKLAAQFAFANLSIHCIEFVIAVDNTPSLHVAKALGATVEGLLRGKILLQGRICDAVLFSLVETDFEKKVNEPANVVA
jgi:RimJ/RimL family protein N-acetyltransferase